MDKYSVQEVCESKNSNKLRCGIEDLRLGMERRKFSYTIHIPERRSSQNHTEAKRVFPKRDTDRT